MSIPKLILILLFALVLAACLAIPTSPASTTPTLIPPSPSVEIPSPAASPPPTATLEPTATPTVAPSATPLLPPATPDPTATATIEVAPTPTPIISPDGAWEVEIAPVDPYARGEREYFQARLVVRSLTDGTEKIVLDEERGYAFGYEPISFIRWSNNGMAFYYSDTPIGDGCGLYDIWNNLYRVTLADSTRVELMPDIVSPAGLSPDEQHLAYLSPLQDMLIVRDLSLGNEVNTPLPPYETAAQIGNFLWSPDSRQVLFVVTEQPCNFDAWGTTIYRYDRATASLSIVIEDSPDQYFLNRWDAPNVVTVYNGTTDETFILDPVTGETRP